MFYSIQAFYGTKLIMQATRKKMFFHSVYGLLVSLSHKMVMQQNIMLKPIRSIVCLKHGVTTKTYLWLFIYIRHTAT